ncbi:MAG: putative toxin-antitoxin system toxin component, PIN family [Nitrospirae bacterium]|nr:MAG: putative toxin-antitoxin system toxin component, PIN family [Nitrospirota bacterium]
MKVVIDTNVIVSAFLNPYGKPAKILRLVIQGSLQIIADERILGEYESVLLRPRFNLPAEDVLNVMDTLRKISLYAPPYHGNLHLPDEGDEPFLEAALSGGADALITGNKKHFPPGRCKGIKVVSAEEFLRSM